MSDRGWVMTQAALLLAVLLYVPLTGAVVGWPLERPGVVSVVAGICVIGLGLGIGRHVARLLGRGLTPHPTPVGDGQLITTGAFAWVRHPLYLGVALIALGWWLIWPTLPGVAAVVAVIVFFDAKASREEELLREVYPDYGSYAARVPHRLIPGLV